MEVPGEGNRSGVKGLDKHYQLEDRPVTVLTPP
jgi:hypothetical protein